MDATRRAFLATFATSALRGELEKGKNFPSDWNSYSDPATEFEVIRLTDPAYSSHLPWYYNRALSRRGGFLLFWSDRTGSSQAFRIDHRSGERKQLTQAEALDGASMALQPDERTFTVFDGPSLRFVNIANLRDRE